MESSNENLDVKDEEQGDICDRCWTIPWEKLTSPSSLASHSPESLVLGDRKQLKASTCPVCRFFGLITEKHSINLRSAVLRWCDAPNNTQDMTTVSLHGLRDGNQPRPHFFITSLELDTALLRLKQFHPREIDINLIKTWMGECDRLHDACNLSWISNSLSDHNIKLIDCIARKVVPGNLKYSFVALSYCWGTSQNPSQETPPDDSCFQLGPHLPATIEDSILLTKALGMRYLWIDRYCIDQTDMKGKHDQIQIMGDIYAASQLTIIAAAGDGPSHGLPGVNTCTRRKPAYVNVRSVMLMHYPPRFAIWSDVLNSEWAHRAWTYQECFLARKRLFFTDTQAGYVCNVGAGRETKPTGHTSKLDNHTMSWALSGLIPSVGRDNDLLNRGRHEPTNVSIQATQYLQAYSTRRLSFDTDALNAITGALNSLRNKHSGINYLWGMPMFGDIDNGRFGDNSIGAARGGNSASGDVSITLGLFWYHNTPCRRRKSLPSWSSLGWEGQIGWLLMPGSESLSPPARKREYEPYTPRSPLFAHVSLTRNQVRILQTSHYLEDQSRNQKYKHNKEINLGVRTIPLRLVSKTEADIIKLQNAATINTSLIAFYYDSEREVLIEPKWDQEPQNFEVNESFQGILIGAWPDTANIANESNVCQPLLIVRRKKNGHHERIGLFWLPLQINGDVCCVHYPYRLKRGTTDPNILRFDDASGFTVKQQGHWFRRGFTSTRIVLE